jgi:hypothetical protein
MPVKPRRWHPDLDASVAPCLPSPSVPFVVPEIAIDFVDLTAVVDRIHAAFFRSQR